MRSLLVLSAMPFVLAACPTPRRDVTPVVAQTPTCPTVAPSAAPSPSTANVAASSPAPTVFHLFKFLAEVGVERDTYLTLPDGTVEAKATFTFRDRSTNVPLATSFELAPDSSVRRYQAWGSTARDVFIDDRVFATSPGAFVVRRLGEPERVVHPDAPFAAISGYAPVLAQELMVRTWIARGRPNALALLPSGTARIQSRGADTYEAEGKKVKLEQLAVQGLVWGREDVWIDEAGRLAAIVTRDDEFDHFEAMRDGLAALAPTLTSRAGADGVRWLAEVGKDAARSESGVVALVGGKLVDGTGRAPVDDAVVVYDGETIVAAGPRATTAIPAGATIIDVAGKTILPGLWDMHAHVEQVEQGAAYLAAGVTTVRDLGNILEFITGVRDAIDAGNGLGPRILVDGIVDGDGPRALGTVRIKTKADIVPVVDRLKKAGCFEVKIYSSIDPALVKGIAVEAHKRGMRVTGHVPTGMNIIEALDAGYDGVNHVDYAIDAMLPKVDLEKLSRPARWKRIIDLDLNGADAQRVFGAIAAHKPIFDDTIALYELFNHTLKENTRREPGIAKLPRELRATLSDIPEDDAPARAAVFDKYVAVVRELHKRGVPIVAGTDIAVPGHSLHRELELYVEAGFTPMEAIQAATIVPARAMKLDARVGTVEKGKRADIVVVAGDPLKDIHDVRKVAIVVTRGRAYDPGKLWQLVGFAP